MKYLIKSYLILLTILFETMLCFAFCFNSKAMFLTVIFISNVFLIVTYHSITLNINQKKDIDLDN